MLALTVTQLNKRIKDILENEVILEHIVIMGEISSFSVTRGIAYFNIKDDESILSCVMFNCRSNFNIGDKVQVTGSINYYVKGGKLSLSASKIELMGQGELYQQYLMLKSKLEGEGLFDSAHKQSIPRYIKRIGVITSKTGAVLQDIINVTSRRNPMVDLVLKDVQVQGVVACEQIVEAINFFSNYDGIDVVVVARGGGSIEDLQPFNEEAVARACYNCKKPIVSAVGHETDFTIIDFVADLRAPTPSAAAELLAFDYYDTCNILNGYIYEYNKQIDRAYNEYALLTNSCISALQDSVKDLVFKLELKINTLLQSCENAINDKVENTIYRVNIALNTLDKLNPINLLKSGYAIISKDNIRLKDYTKIKNGDIIQISTKTNEITAKVMDNKERV
ncbi:MAG: exodeoxyribonuclease VII large subunit [Clostridia bacterium]|nr:exodeoxyribonuclease VII large subunit [Clostridia bacterium]